MLKSGYCLVEITDLNRVPREWRVTALRTGLSPQRKYFIRLRHHTNSRAAALFATHAFVSQFTSLASSLHNRKMTPPPLVAVVIDSYNCRDFIEEVIDSVLLRDFPADQFELIFGDDGSTDDTAEHVRKYGTRAVFRTKTK
jgi:cellulose synthase/poly-beta-1,6-N-acetylglucosamine synthase-like glycosyltransferase